MQTNPLINIVVPVYNEELVLRESITTLEAFFQNSSFPYEYFITIVDNGSTDNTGTIGKDLEQTVPNLRYVNIGEKGKGRAIKRGWQEEGDILVFMDVDLSSDLKYLQPLVDGIAIAYSDLSIGNRLSKESKIVGRRFSRELFSRAYNVLVRFLFQTGVYDHQCGFKAISAKAYSQISKYIKSDGWFFDTEFIVLAQREGLQIRAVPIEWFDNPTSKVSLLKTSKEILTELIVLKLRLLKENGEGKKLFAQVVRFLLSGGVAATLNFLVLYACTEYAHLWYIASVVLAAIASFITSFLLQKIWTFKNRESGKIRRQFLQHALLGIGNILFNVAAVYVLVEWVGLHYLLAQFFALAVITVVNFTLYRLVIFRKSPVT